MARDLANGEISRRTALRRFGAAALGAAVAGPASLFSAESAFARCPADRRCNGRCCPRHSHCTRRGKCRCDAGYKKCSGRCFDLQTNPNHCGDCATTCDPGRACVNGTCTQCSQASDCPDPGTACQIRTCNNGTCANVPASPGAPCTDSGGTMCNGQGQCVQCNSPSDCPGSDTACQTRTCSGGVCGTQNQPNGTVCSGCDVDTCGDNCQKCNNGICAAATCPGVQVCCACQDAAFCTVASTCVQLCS